MTSLSSPVKAYKAVTKEGKRFTVICVNGETKADVQECLDKIYKEPVKVEDNAIQHPIQNISSR